MLDAVNSDSEELEKLNEEKTTIDSPAVSEEKTEKEPSSISSEKDTTELDKVVSSIEEKVAAEPKKTVEEEPSITESKDNATELEKVVSSIEEKVAADAEKIIEKEVSPALDYTALGMEEIVEEIKKLLNNEKIQSIKTSIESLRKSFDTKFSEIIATKKAAFLEEGGDSIDFHFSSPVKVQFNEFINEYRTKRNAHYSDVESQLKENLEKRLSSIEDLKSIIENADSKTMHKEFKELQEKWKAIGPVPRTKYNNTWRNYHHHVERFYDLLHMNNDLRELDFKHNLEEKIKIVETAFELTLLEDVSKAFKGLQELHKAWKEDVGPVSREFREEIWQKFSEATKIIHDKRDAYFEEQKSKYQENLQKKLDVINTLENIDCSLNKTHSDWQKSIKDFESTREVFFTIGKISRNKSQKVWDSLKDVTKKFNQNKNAFYKELNSLQHSNLEKKQALIDLAKSLKDSDDFNTVTGQMKKIQADWKTIGHVPRKHSDKIWKEFKNACNHYFDRIHDIQDNGSSEELEALKTKQEFLSQITAVIGNDNVTLDEVKAYMKTWKNIGRVPRKDKKIESEFNTTLEKLFAQLSIEGEELERLKYRLQIDAYVIADNTRKIDSEVMFVRKKIDEISKGISQSETNISFISNATDDNPLVKSVRDSIAEQAKELKLWKYKLTYLRSLS